MEVYEFKSLDHQAATFWPQSKALNPQLLSCINAKINEINVSRSGKLPPNARNVNVLVWRGKFHISVTYVWTQNPQSNLMSSC